MRENPDIFQRKYVCHNYARLTKSLETAKSLIYAFQHQCDDWKDGAALLDSAADYVKNVADMSDSKSKYGWFEPYSSACACPYFSTEN